MILGYYFYYIVAVVALSPVHVIDKIEFDTFVFVTGDKVERVEFDFVAMQCGRGVELLSL